MRRMTCHSAVLLGLLAVIFSANTLATEVVGGAAAGCVRDAVRLEEDGEGYQILRPARQRNWGHSVTIGFVKALALKEGSAERPLLIADMGLRFGGPMPSGHASHQSGLDVDIWFRRPEAMLAAADLTLPLAETMVNGQGVSSAWTSAQARMLDQAARMPGVERIFVNPAIKKEMCRTAPPDDRAWLMRLRPWWGHDSHFHVRMACPSDSPSCETQKPIPEGDGCGTELESWLDKPTTPAPPDRPHVQTKPLPEACAAILAGG